MNHDEEGAEICAALRFSRFSYDDVMQDMVDKANQQVINGNPFKSITKSRKLGRHYVTQMGGSYRNRIFPSIASPIGGSHPDVPGTDRRQLLCLF